MRKIDPKPQRSMMTCADMVTKINGMFAFALYDNICFVCDYPVSVRMDDEFRYHNESKPSLTFKDDTKVYSWHGRNVPAYIIENPEQITIEKIDQEKFSS